MATVDERIKGKTNEGEVYMELRIKGKRTRIVVQSTGIKTKKPVWYIYSVVPGKNGAVRTLDYRMKYDTAVKFAYDYVGGM